MTVRLLFILATGIVCVVRPLCGQESKGGGLTGFTVISDTLPEDHPLFHENSRIVVDEVRVKYTRNLKERSMASVIITEKKEMEMLTPRNVNEVLQTREGFTNRSGYQAPLTFRGMSGKRLLVLRNGMRRFSSYPAGYMTHTLNIYDLDRIEVEKGAASVRYGAGAMAGIVNLIDKSPFKQIGFNARLSAGYGSNNNEKNAIACGGWSNGKLALKTGLRFRTADSFSYPDGSTAENSFYTDKDLFFAAGYKLSKNQELILTTDIHNGGPWGKPVGFNGSDYMRVQTDNENTRNVALSYGIYPSGHIKSLEINAFYSDEKRYHTSNYYTAAGYRLSYTETTRFSDYYYGTQLRAVVQPTVKYALVVGAEYYSFHISTPTDAIDYINALSFQNRVSHNARSYVAGTYLEGTYNTGRGMKLVTGLRYDQASVYEGDVHDLDRENELETFKNALSGNIAAFYRAGSHTTFRLNAARSFRMPEPTELYADSYTTNGILYANSGLEPEYCHSMDISYNFKNSMVEIEVSPFIWLMNNMISKEEVKSMPGTTYRYVNIGRSRILGGEAVAILPVKNLLKHGDKLQFRMGMAWVNGTDVSHSDHYLDKGIPLDYVPPFNLKTDCSYMSVPGGKAEFTLALRMVYYSRQNRLGGSNFATPAYIVSGFFSDISFTAVKTRPAINLSVNNLLNTKYYDYLSYLPSAGRDIRIMLTFHFN